jgi:temperature dependent protein affecting M2 dsRNA replication
MRIKAIDAIFGSPEILLYEVSEVITSWNLQDAMFTWVRRESCLRDLGVSSDIFVDAVLLSGTSSLPTFPPLESSPRKSTNKVKAAVEMIMNSHNSKTGNSVVIQYEEDPACRQLNYLTRFRKARLAVKHHVYMNELGKVGPLDIESAPEDVHQFISNRLHDELYMYLSKGLIEPRLLNWITSREIVEVQPVDNGESQEYRNLVKEKLYASKSAALAVLSTTMHRVYQHSIVKPRYWFEDPSNQEIAIADLDIPIPLLSNWNAHENVYGLEKNKYWVTPPASTSFRPYTDTLPG